MFVNIKYHNTSIQCRLELTPRPHRVDFGKDWTKWCTDAQNLKKNHFLFPCCMEFLEDFWSCENFSQRLSGCTLQKSLHSVCNIKKISVVSVVIFSSFLQHVRIYNHTQLSSWDNWKFHAIRIHKVKTNNTGNNQRSASAPLITYHLP